MIFTKRNIFHDIHNAEIMYFLTAKYSNIVSDYFIYSISRFSKLYVSSHWTCIFTVYIDRCLNI